jgi:thioredoxin 1
VAVLVATSTRGGFDGTNRLGTIPPIRGGWNTMAQGVHTLDDATFDEEVNGADVPVLVDFWAEWCGPCKMIAPILEEIATDHPETLRVAKLNIDDNPDIARRYEVMAIPTLLVFNKGEQIGRLVGAKGKNQLVQEVDSILRSNGSAL